MEGSDRDPAAEADPLAQVAAAGTRDWTSIGGTAASGPALASWAPGRLDVFARGTDNQVYHRFWNSESWSNWESLDGDISSDPAAVSTAEGRIEVFARGRSNNGLMYRVFDDGAWSARWENLGGTLTGSPAVVKSEGGRIDVFARGPDGFLYQKTQQTGWSAWRRVGPNFGLTSDPAVTSWGEGRFDVIARGTTGDFHHLSYEEGRWGSWQALGSNLMSVKNPPASWLDALSALLGLRIPRSREELVLRWLLELASSASPDLTTAPALTSWGPGRLDLFAPGEDGTLWQRSFENGRWGELVSLGGKVTSAAEAISWGEGQIDLVARDASNAIVYKYYADGSW